MMEPEQDDEIIHSLSPIKVFSYVQKAVEKIDTYPLTKDGIVIQEDAYKRLASFNFGTDRWDDVANEPFAYIHYNRKEKDASLRFAVTFTAEMFSLDIEGMESIDMSYDHFSSEAILGRQIVTILAMLANGQLATLVTTRKNRVCATETLLYEEQGKQPIVLGIEAKYPWYWQESDSTGYGTALLRNDFSIKEIEIPRNLFIFERNKKGAIINRGRDFPTGEMLPLTKGLFNHFFTEEDMRLAGREPNKSQWNLFYGSWEVWVFWALLIAGYFASVSLGILPKLVAEAPPITWPVTLFLTYLIMLPILKKKEAIRRENPDHPWLRFSRVLPIVLATLLRFSMPMLIFMGLFWPTFMLNGNGGAVNWFGIPAPAVVTYVVAILAALGVLVAFSKGVIASAIYVSAVWLAVIGVLVVNFTLTDANADSPEPYSSIAVCVYLFGPFIATYIGWRAIKAGVKEGQLERLKLLKSKGPEYYLGLLTRYIEIVVMAAAAPLLAWAAWLFDHSIPDSSMVYGNTTAVCIGLYVSAFVLATLTVSYVFRIVKPSLYRSLVIFLTIATAFGFGLSLKSNVDQGPNLPWLLLFLSLAPACAAAGLITFFGDKLRTKQYNEQVFAPDHEKRWTKTVRSECVIVTMYASDEESFDSEVEKLEDEIQTLLPLAASIDDRQIGDTSADLYMYGPSADNLWKLIKPTCKGAPFKKIEGTLYHGPVDDPKTAITRKIAL